MQGLSYVVAHRIVLFVPAMLAFLPLGLDHKQNMFYKVHEVLRRCWNILLEPNLLDVNPRLKGLPARATHPLHTAT